MERQTNGLDHLAMEPDAVAEMQSRVKELEAQKAAIEAELKERYQKTKTVAPPALAPPIKNYFVAIVNPDGSLAQIGQSQMPFELVEGKNLIELDQALFDKIRRGLDGAIIPGMMVCHYFMDGEFHQQRQLKFQLPSGPLVHPAQIKIAWDEPGAVKFMEGDTNEVTLFGEVTIEVAEPGSIVLEVIDLRFVRERLAFEVK
jgi:hypothetical protein